MSIDHGYTPGCVGCSRMRMNQPASNHDNLCNQRMDDAVSAAPEGKGRVEAGYGRLAKAVLRASERDARIRASAPPTVPEIQPPASAAGWFLGDNREWKLCKASGQSPTEFAEWRKGYLDISVREWRRLPPEETTKGDVGEEPDDMAAS